jgi:Icc-related predicted phosphoesterase
LPGTSALRVLALADEPPHRPVGELVDALGPQGILLLGDLEPAWTDGLAEVGLPKLGVRGNHDAEDALAAVGAEDLPLRSVELAGLSFAGFGGSPRYSPEGGNQWTEEEAEEMLARLPAADVLLTHSPPAGVNDEPDDRAHCGSPALRAWVEANQPRWLLHGHTLPDPSRAVTQVGPTRVVYVRGAVPLELSPTSS